MSKDRRENVVTGTSRQYDGVVAGRSVGELFEGFFEHEMGRRLDETERARVTDALGRVHEGGGAS